MSTPTITSITPNSGSYLGGTAVTIIGTDFIDAPAPTLTFGGASATSIVVVSTTEITCVTPPGTAGAQDVVFTNNDLGTVTEVGGFTYEAISVASITPNNGLPAGGTPVTISGTGFDTVNPVSVDFDAVAATSVVVVDENTITAVSPAGTGVVDIVVTNDNDAQTDTLAGAYSYVTQASSSVSIPSRMGEAGSVWRSSPGLGDVLNKIADNLAFIKTASQQDTFAEFKVAMEDIDLIQEAVKSNFNTSYVDTSSLDVQVPRRSGEGKAGLNRAQSETLVGLLEVLNRAANILSTLSTASQTADFAAFKTAMASAKTLLKADDSRV